MDGILKFSKLNVLDYRFDRGLELLGRPPPPTLLLAVLGRLDDDKDPPEAPVPALEPTTCSFSLG